MTRTTRKPLKAFCGYSHRDEHYLEVLKTWLVGLERQGLIEEWHDRMISPGDEWEEAIAENLETSQLVLLLVTPDFIASHYIYEKEIDQAIERHSRGEARVIPIIVRPALWEDTTFGKLQALPQGPKPITTWANQDEAWLDVLKGIQQAVQELLFNRQAPEQEDSSEQVYREAVEWAWTDGELHSREVERLGDLANEYELSTASASAIEREVMGDTKEAIQERQEQAAREEEGRNHLDGLYGRARALHRDQKWQAVVDIFAEIHAENPAYPDPEGLMSSAREALETRERTQRVAALYDRGQRHMDAGEWQQALECFEQVQRLQPGYRETEELLSQVRRQLAALSPPVEIDQAPAATPGFRESDRRYDALKRQYRSGDLSAEQLEAQLKDIMVQDRDGNWWSKHTETGEWYFYDGSTWVQRNPPDYEYEPSAAQEQPPPVSEQPRERSRRLMPRLFSRLRGRIREPRRPGVATTIPQPITDDVHFTVVAPEQLLPEQPAPLDVYVHAMADVDPIIRRASREYGQPLRHRSKGPVPIQRGTIMVIRISVPRLDFEGEDLVYWTGVLGNASFVLNVPAATEAGPYAGTVDVLVGGLSIARLQFVLEVGKARGEDVEVTSAMNWLRTAFASYASEDREQVLERIQGMQKILPDLDVFLDVVSLRSGERWEDRLQEEILARDVFYLFWSEAAMKSHWVNFEWHFALEARGEYFISPVPLSPPEVAPPPSELMSRHFRDWTLFLSSGSTPME